METAQNFENTPIEIQEEMSFIQRFGNIFVNPRKAFESIDRKPTWLWPLVIIIILIAATTQIMFPVVMQAQLDKLRSNANIPAEQMQVIEQQFAQGGSTQRIITIVSQVIVMPLIYLLLAGIFYFIGSVLLGGDATYKKVLSVLAWSGCISIAATIVMMPLIMIKKSLTVSLSLALLLPIDSSETTLYRILSKIDFFTIWYMIVFALGFSIIYKFSRAKAFTAIGVLWAIWIAISVAFAGFFSRFGM
jgi:hypothetical protein